MRSEEKDTGVSLGKVTWLVEWFFVLDGPNWLGTAAHA